ncbi:alpha-(1,3)-fucosyltransferase C-like [Anoplophora glabripennis]|uniref:alpha-(1,3)-fucosyltransferase C-like n=1 Tax=Anoplophora glabripennis TaxID=217634 RepID=UPI000873D2E6|nr:alpha-(1,3)-fucosyltransferase C-like [Anoplophora glabripennis]XP_018564447.1 alpha-(1,3)-fucosyltransferase C-like [Anoplophora glabripennis]XP_018564448.1 alpha-(1,3)-fucosyltransferase C-like [Anoplophora glabripennis]XP_018564450.1 alpha-(1,3)-fucosyltransferase C-like [Anoplophora glabripennis]XP_018564451.1 alpha-(1,3)-fucosyltransferase C-like [Anoplophora glabripennis]
MKRNTGLFLVLTTISCLLLLQYLYYTSVSRNAPENVESKNILYWTKMFDRADFYLGLGSQIFEGCEFSNCYATVNKSYLPVDQFDAILFHGNEYHWEDQGKPESRSRHQYYIYSNQESPIYSTQGFGPVNFFNWTMTYRSDSDIMRPYGYYQKATTVYKMPTAADVQQRPHKIVWMVSNCNAMSNRNDLFEKLNKHIPIDVYGTCGNKSCPKETFDECYDRLATNYKFYLSFENSICSEYVTEKLYAALMRDFVPIVYGGADYSKIAPPNSVIDVSKFSSIKELAEFIKTLDEDPKKYLSYFEWKKEYIVKRDNKLTLCTLCRKLNEPIVHKSYTNIRKWWSYEMCFLDYKLPEVIFT